MYISGPFDRTGIQMGGHLGIVNLGNGRDFLSLPDAAYTAQRGLQAATGQALHLLGVGQELVARIADALR